MLVLYNLNDSLKTPFRMIVGGSGTDRDQSLTQLTVFRNET